MYLLPCKMYMNNVGYTDQSSTFTPSFLSCRSRRLFCCFRLLLSLGPTFAVCHSTDSSSIIGAAPFASRCSSSWNSAPAAA